jgi:hypothetical protein
VVDGGGGIVGGRVIARSSGFGMAGQSGDVCGLFAFFWWMAGPSVRSFQEARRGRAGSVICVCTIRHCNLYFGPFSVSGGKQSIGWEGRGLDWLGGGMGGHKHKRIVCCLLLSISIDFGMFGLG